MAENGNPGASSGVVPNSGGDKGVTHTSPGFMRSSTSGMLNKIDLVAEGLPAKTRGVQQGNPLKA